MGKLENPAGTSDLPMAASMLRLHLATLTEVVTASRQTAEAWITDAEKLPHPDGLADWAQRREHLERPLSHLAHGRYSGGDGRGGEVLNHEQN